MTSATSAAAGTSAAPAVANAQLSCLILATDGYVTLQATVTTAQQWKNLTMTIGAGTYIHTGATCAQ